MQLGLRQIQANRAVWMSKAQQQQPPPPMDEATSSGSTITVTSTPESGVRKVASSGDLNERGGAKGSRMRKERSFSSLMFWKKKGRQALLGEP